MIEKNEHCFVDESLLFKSNRLGDKNEKRLNKIAEAFNWGYDSFIDNNINFIVLIIIIIIIILVVIFNNDIKNINLIIINTFIVIILYI